MEQLGQTEAASFKFPETSADFSTPAKGVMEANSNWVEVGMELMSGVVTQIRFGGNQRDPNWTLLDKAVETF